MSGFIDSLKAAAYKTAESISKGNIFDLIKMGNYEGLILHLEKYPQDIEAKNENKYTPLTYAYLADMTNISGPPETRSEIISLLVKSGGLNIQNGEMLINSKKNVYLDSSTPLLFSIVTKKYEMTTDLIERGADVDDKGRETKLIKKFMDSVQDEPYENRDDYIHTYTEKEVSTYRVTTPLIASIEFMNPTITTMILEKMNENEKQKNKKTNKNTINKKMNENPINKKVNGYGISASALKFAFMWKKPEFVLLLISYGADVTGIDIHTGDTYLHDAINTDFPLDVAEALIEKYPAIVNKVNKERPSRFYGEPIFKKEIPPLVDACRIGNLPLIELLLQNGADPNHLYIDPYDIRRKISPLINAVINVKIPTTKLLLTYNTKPIDEITITHYVRHNQRRESRLFDYFITTIANKYDHSEYDHSDDDHLDDDHSYDDLLNMIFLLLENGATKNENFNYRDVHPSIKKFLTDYRYYLSVASLQANDIYPHLDPDSQKQFADHMIKERPDRAPQYWKDNNDKFDYIEKNIENIENDRIRLDASYRFKKFLDESRFKSQEYYNDKLNEIHQYVLTNQNPKNSVKGGKKTRRTPGGKAKTPHGGKVKTPHGGKAKTRRYKKA
jgi:ankyrin repeat protein